MVARPLAVMGHSVLGVDLSRPMLTNAASRIERSVLVEADAWNRVVQPIIDGLRALLQPDRPRRCRQTHELACYRLQPE